MTEQQCVDPSVTAHISVCQQTGITAVAQDKTIVLHFGASHISFPVDAAVGTIRALDFLQNSNGFFAVGGDNKHIVVYDCSKPNTCEKVDTYGPHAKRITSILSIDSTNSFIFSDKFGETYLLRFKNPKSPREGLAAPVFMMQHMSVLTKVLVTKPSIPTGRRLLTADRDSHLRVSRFPNAFDIDEFLWRDSPQTVVCALAEISGVAGGAQEGKNILVAAGGANGHVNAYSIDNDGAVKNILVGIENGAAIHIDDSCVDAEVVALGEARSANGKHSVLIAALDRRSDVSYFPVSRDGTIDVNAVKKCTVGDKKAKDAVVTTCAAANGRDLFVLLRSGTVGHFVLSNDGELAYATSTSSLLQKECVENFSRVLADSDFNAVWKSMAIEAKTRKAADEEDDIEAPAADGDKLDKKIAKKE